MLETHYFNIECTNVFYFYKSMICKRQFDKLYYIMSILLNLTKEYILLGRYNRRM